MSKIFLFDVDGTLTGYRRQISPKHKPVFDQLADQYPVYLITGSDRKKLESQMPSSSLMRTEGIYTCSGCEYWEDNKLIQRSDCEFPEDLMDFLLKKVAESSYSTRTGNHIEPRTGSLNFSIVGRNATPHQRNHYANFDQKTKERDNLAQEISERFPTFDVYRGGQISIDITPKGWNKSQCLKGLMAKHESDEIHFFGDNMGLGGNDRPLAQAILASQRPGITYPVSSPDETFEILEKFVDVKNVGNGASYIPGFARSNLSIALI